jgi:hypothetical protein
MPHSLLRGGSLETISTAFVATEGGGGFVAEEFEDVFDVFAELPVIIDDQYFQSGHGQSTPSTIYSESCHYPCGVATKGLLLSSENVTLIVL